MRVFILVLNDCFHIDFSTFRRDLHFLNIKARLISFLKFSEKQNFNKISDASIPSLKNHIQFFICTLFMLRTKLFSWKSNHRNTKNHRSKCTLSLQKCALSRTFVILRNSFEIFQGKFIYCY